MHKRLGIPKKSVDATAEKALRFGVARRDVKAGLRRYLDMLWWSSTPKNNIRIYNRNVYIFDDNILVTVLPLPKRYHASADKLQSEQNRDDL